MAIKILNKIRLQRQIDRIPDAAKQEIKKELKYQAKMVVALMKHLVPTNTGQARDSIGWTWGKAPSGKTILGKIKSNLASDLTITIYAGGGEAFYVTFLEWGTHKMPAHPFFYPAWRAKKKDVRKGLRDAIRRGIKKTKEEDGE